MRWIPLALVVLAFGWTLGFDFVHDDHSLVVANADLAAGDWAALGGQPLTRWMGAGYPYYRPLPMLSYLLGAHHAVNVVLAGLAALAVAALARALGEDERVALAAGCLFALHPAHAEAVAWVSARADLLAGLAALGAWTAHLTERRGLALVFFAAALASKESAAALPLAMLIVRPAGARRLVPFVVIAVAWLGVRGLVVGAPPFALRHQLARSQAAGALWHLALEIGGHLAGAGTARLDFTVRRLASAGGPELWLSGVASALLVALFLKEGRALGLATLALFAPLAGLLALPGTALFALRYLYLPSALVAVVLARACLRAGAWSAVLLGALFALRLALATAPLASARSLWEHETRVSPEWSVAHGNLGLALLAANDPAAETELACAVELAPADGRKPVDALFGLGRARLARRDIPGASKFLEEAFALDPSYPKLAANLGFAYLLGRRPVDARRALERAVELDPRDETSRANLRALP